MPIRSLPLIQPDKTVRGFVTLKQQTRGCYRRFAVGIQSPVAPVVENDVGRKTTSVGVVDLACQALGNSVSRWLLPIRGHRIPCHGRHSQVMRRLQHGRPAAAKGRAEIAHSLAQDLLEGCARAVEFFVDAARAGEGKVGVAPGMVADEMSFFGDTPNEGRFQLGESSDQKKCPLDSVVKEEVEQVWRPGRVGAIVKR